MIQPIKIHEVKNYRRAIISCVLDTLESAAQAAMHVPKPGNIKLKNAAIHATGFVTYGTLETMYHTCVSISSTTITLFYIWLVTACFTYSLSIFFIPAAPYAPAPAPAIPG